VGRATGDGVVSEVVGAIGMISLCSFSVGVVPMEVEEFIGEQEEIDINAEAIINTLKCRNMGTSKVLRFKQSEGRSNTQ